MLQWLPPKPIPTSGTTGLALPIKPLKMKKCFSGSGTRCPNEVKNTERAPQTLFAWGKKGFRNFILELLRVKKCLGSFHSYF